ncbi:hypothetical protein, partial [Shigella sonnei]|uniref:hypothetical protein n=1 Tax=Shigella sonnei TaxID=624 RepID=UPI001C0A7886
CHVAQVPDCVIQPVCRLVFQDGFSSICSCCFFVDAGNKKLVFWFVRVDDEGYPEIARCTEREFATILSGISAGGMYCPECGTVHWPDGVAPPF